MSPHLALLPPSLFLQHVRFVRIDLKVKVENAKHMFIYINIVLSIY